VRRDRGPRSQAPRRRALVEPPTHGNGFVGSDQAEEGRHRREGGLMHLIAREPAMRRRPRWVRIRSSIRHTAIPNRLADDPADQAPCGRKNVIGARQSKKGLVRPVHLFGQRAISACRQVRAKS